MNKRKSVTLTLLVSGVAVGLGTLSLPSWADSVYIGRHTDKPHAERTTAAKVSASSQPSTAAYAGRRIDQPSIVLARRPAEQAELAAFEAGRTAVPRHADSYIGRRADSLR